MKHIHLLLTIFCVFLMSEALAEEITLTNSKGDAVAYICEICDDENFTIYLWRGRPVAYIEEASIWSFDGTHIGWFKEGMIWDQKGFKTGAIRSATDIIEKIEPLKGIRGIVPIKSFRDAAPPQPVYQDKWSDVSLSKFLLQE